jgi:isoleucyl-tRNA synthetase
LPRIEIFFAQSKIKILEEAMGALLTENICLHPLYPDLRIPIVHSDHVTLTEGTGIVHIAPEFGYDDFLLSQQHQLSVNSTMNETGQFTEQCLFPSIQGIFYQKTENIIIEALKQHKKL